MNQPLQFDADVVRATASALKEAASRVPVAEPLNLAHCGSSAVAAAATRFNDRANRYGVLLALQLADVGGDASKAAETWAAKDAALAAGVQP